MAREMIIASIAPLLLSTAVVFFLYYLTYRTHFLIIDQWQATKLPATH